jgi:hypothetical protein
MTIEEATVSNIWKFPIARRGGLALLTLTTWLTPVGVVSAEVQTITTSHTYVMGDNDSRNDARQLCFLEAKRKVLEKAGSFIQSHSVVARSVTRSINYGNLHIDIALSVKVQVTAVLSN